MNATVLAAGQGVRLLPLTENRPKHLLPVGGEAIIIHLLRALRRAGVKQGLVVVGYRSEMIQEHVSSQRLGLELEYVFQKNVSGTASAFALSERFAGDEPMLGVYGDLFVTHRAIREVIKSHQASGCPTVGVVRVRGSESFGVVRTDGDWVKEIVEKPGSVGTDESLVNAGVYVLTPEVFKAIKETQRSKRGEYEVTDSLQSLIRSGTKVRAAKIQSRDWMDMGRPWDLLRANEQALSNLARHTKGTVERGAILKGRVSLGKGSHVRSGSYIEGPVWIGENVTIGPNSRIRPYTCLYSHVEVGTSCEIKNSIIMSGTKIPHLSYVGDSIIGENCNLGAGTNVANLRLDEKPVKVRVRNGAVSTGLRKFGVILGDNVSTGINCSLMPGVKVGCSSWIGPGVVLDRDVPSGTFIQVRQELDTANKP